MEINPFGDNFIVFFLHKTVKGNINNIVTAFKLAAFEEIEKMKLAEVHFSLAETRKSC